MLASRSSNLQGYRSWLHSLLSSSTIQAFSFKDKAPGRVRPFPGAGLGCTALRFNVLHSANVVSLVCEPQGSSSEHADESIRAASKAKYLVRHYYRLSVARTSPSVAKVYHWFTGAIARPTRVITTSVIHNDQLTEAASCKLALAKQQKVRGCAVKYQKRVAVVDPCTVLHDSLPKFYTC